MGDQDIGADKNDDNENGYRAEVYISDFFYTSLVACMSTIIIFAEPSLVF